MGGIEIKVYFGRVPSKSLFVSARKVVIPVSRLSICLLKAFCSGTVEMSMQNSKETAQLLNRFFSATVLFFCNPSSLQFRLQLPPICPIEAECLGFYEGKIKDDSSPGHSGRPYSGCMKRGELTLMVCADYSKAFNTVKFKSDLTKMHSMGFSKSFWIINYLCDRRQFVQIDAKVSEYAVLEFGLKAVLSFLTSTSLTHENILAHLQCPCFKYARMIQLAIFIRNPVIQTNVHVSGS